MAGQRRRPLDADLPRIGVGGRRQGLVATNQRVIGAATSVAVQLSPALKVAARVLAADPVRDVAVLRIDSTVTDSVRPVPLECAQAAKSPVVDGQEIFTIGAPLRGQKGMTSGIVSRVEPQAIVSDFSSSPAVRVDRSSPPRRRRWDHLARGRDGGKEARDFRVIRHR